MLLLCLFCEARAGEQQGSSDMSNASELVAEGSALLVTGSLSALAATGTRAGPAGPALSESPVCWPLRSQPRAPTHAFFRVLRKLKVAVSVSETDLTPNFGGAN
jgi:hypothetical protein